MSELPSVTADEAIAVFEKNGFSIDRVSGSHYILKKSGHRHNLSIPKHGNKPLKPGLLRAQIKSAGLTVEDFVAGL